MSLHKGPTFVCFVYVVECISYVLKFWRTCACNEKGDDTCELVHVRVCVCVWGWGGAHGMSWLVIYHKRQRARVLCLSLSANILCLWECGHHSPYITWYVWVVSHMCTPREKVCRMSRDKHTHSLSLSERDTRSQKTWCMWVMLQVRMLWEREKVMLQEIRSGFEFVPGLFGIVLWGGYLYGARPRTVLILIEFKFIVQKWW